MGALNDLAEALTRTNREPFPLSAGDALRKLRTEEKRLRERFGGEPGERPPSDRMLAAQQGVRLNLVDPARPDNNAFIMFIRDKAFVEFGVTGNACFVFGRQTMLDMLSVKRKADIDFTLRASIAADATGLKGPSYRHRLIHSSSGWERKFADVITQETGARPISTFPSSALPHTARTEHGGPQTTAPPPTSSERFSDEAFARWAARHAVTVYDYRDRGGNLWAQADNVNAAIDAQLKAWGFRWAEPKKAWYLGHA